MLDFGWKKKAELLRGVLLSGAHQLAKDLPPGFAKFLETFRQVAKSGDERYLEDLAHLDRDYPDEPRPRWEPAEIYGWKIAATGYLQRGQLWWLLHAIRHDGKDPSAKAIAVLDKVLDHLGADPKRDMIIGPYSGPADEPGLLPFGWWTWFNRSPLFEVQINKHKKKAKDMLRIVPLGEPETDGYQSLDKFTKDD